MTDYQDYMNTHKLYPDDISRRIDIPPGFDSARPTVKESLTTALDENGLARCGCGGEARLWPDGRESRTYHVVCCECRASAHYFANEQEAKDAWNRAMGYKEADE